MRNVRWDLEEWNLGFQRAGRGGDYQYDVILVAADQWRFLEPVQGAEVRIRDSEYNEIEWHRTWGGSARVSSCCAAAAI